MRQHFRAVQASSDNAPEGHLWFDLVTGDRDTFKTRLKPSGARFHSEARPWLNTHNDKDASKVIGNMVESRQSSDSPFQVLVKFDDQDPEAMKIYDKHKRGVLKGCSVGFLPIPGKFHVEMEDDGQKTIVYDEYYILEGSSCGVPSNPTALMRSAELVIEDALAAEPVKPSVTPSAVQTRATPTVGSAPVKTFSTDVQGKWKPMQPEQRAMHRAMIGDSLRSAEDHMQCHAALPEFPEHREFHAGEARACMKRCAAMTRMVHDSLHAAGEATPEPAPTDAKVGAMMRCASLQNADAALLAEFKETYRNCAGYATRSYRDIGESIAKSPAELRTKWLATQQIEAMHRKALVEKRNAAAELEAQQRAAIIEELKNGPGLEPGIECEILGLDPTDPKRQTRSADGPMSLADLTALRNSLMGAAQVLTRTAALTPAATAAETDEALKQPAPPPRPDTSGKVDGVDPKVMEALRAGARSAGLNLDNALAAARRMS